MQSPTDTSLEELYSEIHHVGVVGFLDHIESERRAHLTAQEISRLYQKGFKIATLPIRASHLNDTDIDPSEWLCTRYVEEILACVETTVMPALASAATAGPEAFLREWSRRWTRFTAFVKGVRTIFMYLDQFYTHGMNMTLRQVAFHIYHVAIWRGIPADASATTFVPRLQAAMTSKESESIAKKKSEASAAAHGQRAAATPASVAAAAPVAAVTATGAAGAGAEAGKEDGEKKPMTDDTASDADADAGAGDKAPSSFASIAIDSIIALMEADRRRTPIDVSLLSSSCAVFYELGQELPQLRFSTADSLALYSALEKRVVDATRAYYTAKAAQWLQHNSGSNYLRLVEGALTEEDARAVSYLHPSSQHAIFLATYMPLVTAHLDTLSQYPHARRVLDENIPADLELLFRIFSLDTSCRDVLTETLFSHVRERGAEILRQAEAAEATAKEEREVAKRERFALIEAHKQAVLAAQKAGTAPPPPPALPQQPAVDKHIVVVALINLHRQYYDAITASEGNTQQLLASLRRAFETFLSDSPRVPVALAAYAHEALQRGGAIEAVDSALQDTVLLYGYTREKDVFEHEYQKFLRQRLFMGTSVSEAAEQKMVTLLKQQSGFSWTTRLDTMFSDVLTSHQFMAGLKQKRAQSGRGPFVTGAGDAIDLSVTVCTAGNWGLPNPGSEAMPADLAGAASDFSKAYVQQHQGRRLAWHLDQGSAELAVTFSPTVTRTLVVTSYMMLALLAFNKGERVLTFGSIVRSTGAPEAELNSHVQSLVARKVLIMKRPGDIRSDTELMINPKFTSNIAKVQVPLIKVATAAEVAEDKIKIDTGRANVTDAAIVRILKARKEMHHNELVGEVMRQQAGRFPPQQTLIKTRIEELIREEYLMRDEKDRTLYKYIA